MKLKQFLVLFTMLGFLACSSSSEGENKPVDHSAAPAQNTIYERLNVPDFQAKLATVPNPQLVDVRTPEEFANGNIAGAVNINIHDADFLQNINKIDKNKPVFVYCQAGGRSKKCAEKMKSLGFSEIYELEPGYAGWEH